MVDILGTVKNIVTIGLAGAAVIPGVAEIADGMQSVGEAGDFIHDAGAAIENVNDAAAGVFAEGYDLVGIDHLAYGEEMDLAAEHVTEGGGLYVQTFTNPDLVSDTTDGLASAFSKENRGYVIGGAVAGIALDNRNTIVHDVSAGVIQGGQSAFNGARTGLARVTGAAQHTAARAGELATNAQRTINGATAQLQGTLGGQRAPAHAMA